MELKQRRWSKLWGTVNSFGFGNDDDIQRYSLISIEPKRRRERQRRRIYIYKNAIIPQQ